MKQYFACLKHAFTKKTLPMQTSILRLLFVVLVMSMCAPIWAVQDSTQYKALEQKLDSLDRELAKLNQEMIDQYNLIRQCKTPEQQLAKLEEYNVAEMVRKPFIPAIISIFLIRSFFLLRACFLFTLL